MENWSSAAFLARACVRAGEASAAPGKEHCWGQRARLGAGMNKTERIGRIHGESLQMEDIRIQYQGIK